MKSKKRIIIPILLLLLLIGLKGTIAWLTSTDQIVNQFTIGEINNPTTDPDGNAVALTGNLFEKNWDSSVSHKLIPGVSFTKEPYVGVGAGSEECVVYVYVDNDFTANSSNKVYFTLGSGWTAVTNHATTGPIAGTYTKGLFKYNTNLAPSANIDAWTTALFTTIDVADNASVADLTPINTSNITIKSLVHQAKNASGVAIDSATIETAAINTLES